ncbi:TPA: hypothetical protein ROU78_004550 [Yersinia enterocolitica]|nr:hypothetical protein [Yersinia enterocolitica]HDL8229700.1 hypothetical protein [Yersinia enterocolitica]HDX8417812.1 hypothetical protein [Yersinia enterocolitica]HEN3551575.1 hypothetical protein [Yersinia enterocolitica]
MKVYILNKQEVVINSEDEAFAFIEQYVSGYSLPENVSFGDWPNLKFKLTGKKFNKSLTPSVMKGFIEMQAQINKSYALVKYGVPDPRKLSKEEKEALEIEVTVEQGSSLIEVNIDGFLTKITHELVGKMNPQDIVVTVLGIALIWGGTTLFKKFLDNRKEARLAEIKKESDKEHLNTIQFMSAQETQRLEILGKLITERPQLDNMERLSYDAKTEMVKSFATAKTAQIDNIELDSEMSRELVTNARRKSIELRMDGMYRIEEVNSTDPESFKVKVRNIQNDQRINCVVQDVFLDAADNKRALQQAEWDRKPVHLSINAKHIDGEIKSAIILYVKEATPPQE